MAIVIDAAYENGVRKPAEPLPPGEHERVRVTPSGCEAIAKRFPS